jgi:MFS family permease
VAELFGLRFHVTLYSWTVFTSCIGSAAGPFLAGALFDARGNYHLAFFLCLVFSMIGLGATLLIHPIQGKLKIGNCLSADCADKKERERK